MLELLLGFKSTCTHKRNNLWNGPEHFSSTPFFGWHLSCVFLFSFFFHVVICPVAKWLNSCQRGADLGRDCVFSQNFLSEWPLCALWQDLDQNSFCVSSAVFLGLIFIVQIASFDRASEIISESVPYSCLCIRIKPPPLPTHFCFKAVCYLPGGRLLPGRIIWMHVNKMVRSHLSWHTYWYVAVKL